MLSNDLSKYYLIFTHGFSDPSYPSPPFLTNSFFSFFGFSFNVFSADKYLFSFPHLACIVGFCYTKNRVCPVLWDSIRIDKNDPFKYLSKAFIEGDFLGVYYSMLGGSFGDNVSYHSVPRSVSPDNIGRYILVESLSNGSAFIPLIADTLDECTSYIRDRFFVVHNDWSTVPTFEIYKPTSIDFRPNGLYYGDFYRFRGCIANMTCCYPDFAPIVQILGGTPSSDQLTNLKLICQLLGVSTAENVLSGCDLMKEYLKRLVLNFGSTPSTEPNDNLKSICHFLGVDTSENGLSGCELSKEYVKRDGQMLGAIINA